MSEAKSIWGLRLLAVVLAIIAWFFISLEGREAQGQKVIEAFVAYNTPENLTILDPIEKVRIVVLGPASKIGNLNPFQVSVTVDLREAETGELEVNLGDENVSLPEGFEVLSMEPNPLLLELDLVVTDMRPVEPRLTGEPAAGAIYLQPEVLPPMVLVRGPESRLKDIVALTTSPVSLDGHALDFDQQARVVSPDPLVQVMQPALVTVRIAMEMPDAGGGQ